MYLTSYFLIYILLKYSWFTMLCWFLLYSKVIQLYINKYKYIYILFYILFHYGLSQDIEYSSLCYTVGPCCLSFLYIIVCLCIPPPPTPTPWQPPVCSLCLGVCFCFIDKFFCVIFYPHISDIIWYSSFFCWLTSPCMIISRSIHVAANGIISFFFMAE